MLNIFIKLFFIVLIKLNLITSLNINDFKPEYDANSLNNKKIQRGISLLKIIEDNDNRLAQKQMRYSCHDKEDEGHYEHPDCHKYWHCLYVGTIFETALERKCPIGTMFHPVQRVCEISTMLNCLGWYKSIYGKDFQKTSTSLPIDENYIYSNEYKYNSNEYYGSSENSYETQDYYNTYKINTDGPINEFYRTRPTQPKIFTAIIITTTSPEVTTTIRTTTTTKITTTTRIKLTTKTTTRARTTARTSTTTTRTTTPTTSSTTLTSKTTTTISTTFIETTTTPVENENYDQDTEHDAEYENETDDEQAENEENYDEEESNDPNNTQKNVQDNETTKAILTTKISFITKTTRIVNMNKNEDSKYLNKYTTLFSSNLLEKLRNMESNENNKETNTKNETLENKKTQETIKNFTILTSSGKKTVLITKNNETSPNKVNIFTSSKNESNTQKTNVFSLHNRTNYDSNPIVIDKTTTVEIEQETETNNYEHKQAEDSTSAFYDDIVQAEDEEIEKTDQDGLEKDDPSLMDSDLLLNLQLNTNIKTSKSNNNQDGAISESENENGNDDGGGGEYQEESSDYHTDNSQAFYSESSSTSSALNLKNIKSNYFFYSFLSYFYFSLVLSKNIVY